MTRTRRRSFTRQGTGDGSPRRAPPLDAVSEAAGFDFSSLPEAEEVDTIGGLVTAAAGRVPDRGEILLGPGEFEYEVLDADPRRIKRVKIGPSPPSRGSSAPTPEASPGDPA